MIKRIKSPNNIKVWLKLLAMANRVLYFFRKENIPNGLLLLPVSSFNSGLAWGNGFSIDYENGSNGKKRRWYTGFAGISYPLTFWNKPVDDGHVCNAASVIVKGREFYAKIECDKDYNSWPAFWLMSRGMPNGLPEYDILEYFAHEGKLRPQGAVHWGADPKGYQLHQFSYPLYIDMSIPHVWGIKIYDNKIEWSCDYVVYAVNRFKEALQTSFEFDLMLNQSIVDINKDTYSKMVVHWVKYK